MIHYVNTDISPADLLAAADDAGLTISQFEAKAINDAVEAYKRKQQNTPTWDTTRHTSRLGVVPGGD